MTAWTDEVDDHDGPNAQQTFWSESPAPNQLPTTSPHAHDSTKIAIIGMLMTSCARWRFFDRMRWIVRAKSTGGSAKDAAPNARRFGSDAPATRAPAYERAYR